MDDFAIHRAARQGNLEKLRRLVKKSLSVDSRDNLGRSPLHLAAAQNQYEVVVFLISSKCDFNLKDNDGRTPVLSAAVMENSVVINLLLDHGAKVTSADLNSWTLLHYSSFYGWVDIAQRIVESGEANLNAATELGWVPLMLAVSRAVSGCGCKEMATLLIRAGADINRRDARKMTALHWAAYEGETKVVQVLLEKEGLDLNPQDERGETPLHRACRWRRTGVLRQLLAAGADPKVKNNDGETALSVGIKQEKLSLGEIMLFVEHGAFFDDCDCVQISNNAFLKESVLKDVDLCTKSIVNKFHSHSLPSLYRNPYFAKQLPSLEKFKLNTRQIDDVKNSVKIDIQMNAFCNLVKACPMALTAFCVKSLLSCQT